MKTIHCYLLISGMAFLTACTDTPDPQPKATSNTQETISEKEEAAIPDTERERPEVSHTITEQVFRCTDGEEFIVSFGDQTARIKHHDSLYELRQQQTSSGIRYADETVDFLSKADQAVISVADQTHDCSMVAEEQARILGPKHAPP